MLKKLLRNTIHFYAEKYKYEMAVILRFKKKPFKILWLILREIFTSPFPIGILLAIAIVAIIDLFPAMWLSFVLLNIINILGLQIDITLWHCVVGAVALVVTIGCIKDVFWSDK